MNEWSNVQLRLQDIADINVALFFDNLLENYGENLLFCTTNIRTHQAECQR